MKYVCIVLAISFVWVINTHYVQAKASKKQRIIYKYKKYQKFDFEAMGVSGDTSSPGDLSIRTRKQKGFRNRLPFRRNFNSKIRRAIERIR